MKMRGTSVRAMLVYGSLGLGVLVAGGCATSKHYTVDPTTIELMPTEAAASFLEPILDNAVSYNTRERLHCRLDAAGISCAGVRYPLSEWVLLENVTVFSRDRGVFMFTSDSHRQFGPFYGPTGKGLSIVLHVADDRQANLLVSALKSLGVRSARPSR